MIPKSKFKPSTCSFNLDQFNRVKNQENWIKKIETKFWN